MNYLILIGNVYRGVENVLTDMDDSSNKCKLSLFRDSFLSPDIVLFLSGVFNVYSDWAVWSL
jgi:hypothetical protein